MHAMNVLEQIVKNSSGQTREILEQFVHQTADLVKEQRRLKQQLEYVSNENRLLRKRLYGASSEKQTSHDIPEQLNAEMFDEFELCAHLIEPDSQLNNTDEATPSAKKRSSRKALPKGLPRQVIEHDLSAEEKICQCGDEMQCFGSSTSEELEYQAPKLTVIEHRCKKYACTRCNKANKANAGTQAQLKTAIKPLQLIPKSIATPSLLAQIAIQKFCDHLPLYRQENIFKRYSIHLSRQTMSKWMLKVGDALIPLCNLLQEKIVDYDVAYADETTLQVLKEPGRRAQTKSYMWCFMGGPPDKRIITYQYHVSRKAEIAEQFFKGYQGALHCDGYSGYAKLIQSENIVGLNCMAHVRRKFVDALPNGKMKGISGQVVRILRQLYKIEQTLKEEAAKAEVIKSVRQEKSKPILEALKTYLDTKVQSVPPKSKVGEAISYTLKRWPYLITYLSDSRYEIDSNRCERAIKPFVMGRKAWLFSNSTHGAHTSARLFSLIETAKANEIEPCIYLNYVFEKLAFCQVLEDYEALLPWRVKASLADSNL